MNGNGDSLLKFNSISKQNQAAARDSRAGNRKGWKQLWRPLGPGNSSWPQRTATTDGISLTRKQARLSLLMGDKQRDKLCPTRALSASASLSPCWVTARRGPWARLVALRFVFCTRMSTGTSNAAVETLYCCSAEQFQKLGWDLKSQSKSRGLCILAPPPAHSLHWAKWCWTSHCHLLAQAGWSWCLGF